MLERRAQQRTRTFLKGEVAYNHRAVTCGCLVRNLSDMGARLIFESPTSLPEEFDLQIRDGADFRRVRIVWRCGREFGVAIVERSRARVVSIDTTRRLRELEAERDALRRRVQQLSEPA